MVRSQFIVAMGQDQSPSQEVAWGGAGEATPVPPAAAVAPVGALDTGEAHPSLVARAGAGPAHADGTDRPKADRSLQHLRKSG